jgi:hypothetical protein
MIEQVATRPSIARRGAGYGEDEEPLLGAGAFGVTGMALDPFPVVLDDEPGPMPGVVNGALRLLVAEGAAGGGLDEPELESLSQATSAKVASVPPIAMIVFFMIRLSEWFLHRGAGCRFRAKRSLLRNMRASEISPCLHEIVRATV